MTTKQSILRPAQYGGVETSAKPHLVSAEQWLTGTNVEFFNGATQVARKSLNQNLRANTDAEVVLLAAVAKRFSRAQLIAMTQEQIFTSQVGSGTNTGIEVKRRGNILRFNVDGEYRRWGTTMYNGHLYFINELNQLRYTDGTEVYSLNTGESIPSGRYVENFYDHMVVGYPSVGGHTYPTRVMMSHLYDFGKWAPDATKEADYFDVEEWCRHDLPVYGITGLRKSGNLCMVYTPSAIIGLQYVGLPKVLQFNSVVEDCGCGLPWSLVTLGGRHYFFNIMDMNFYCFNGSGIQPIGNSIQTWLLSKLPTDVKKLSKMWGYVDHAYNKIVWVFESASGNGKMDAYVAFNYRTEKWGHGYCENIHSFLPGMYMSKKFGQGSGTIASQSQSIRDAGESAVTFSRLYGTNNCNLLQDLALTEAVTTAVDCPVPVLETGDLVYGSLDKIKEVDSIVIHATRVNPSLGIKVEYSVRDNLEAAVSWTEIAQRWTPSLPEKRLSFPRVAGRVFRFRFTPVAETTTTTTTTKNIANPGFSMRAELTGEVEGGEVVDPPDPPGPPPVIEFGNGFNGPVYHILPSGGGMYVVGRFTQYQGQNCKGIARINGDGTLDTTFAPGGVAGGGFDFAYPYFAPTQLQGAADGGVFVGMSYYRLPEPRLFDDRGEATRGDYEHLSLNGVEKPPVLKLKRDGTVDTSFDASSVNGASTEPKFMSFHMYEAGNMCFYTYQRNVECFEDVPPYTFDLGGTDFCVLECRTMSGDLVRRLFMRTNGSMVGAFADYTKKHQVFIDEGSNLLHWSGLDFSQRSAGGLVAMHAGSENRGLPQAWRCVDVELAVGPGVLTFDLSLNLRESSNWAGYNAVGIAAGLKTTFFPNYLTRGCFKGSVVGSSHALDGLTEGGWACSANFQHKGVMHVCLDQSFTSGSFFGNGDGSFSLANVADGARIRVYSPYSFSPIQFDAIYHLGEPDQALFASISHHEGQQIFDPALLAGSYNIELSGGTPTGCQWFVDKAAWRTVDKTVHLWDMRSGGDPADPTLHGFSPFFGATVDNDGCTNCQVLIAQHDSTTSEARLSTDPNLGVFVTGMLAKFKGVVRATASGQLFKISHNGAWLGGTFVPPTFGPASFNLPKEISSGAAELHYSKITCAAVDRTNRVLYVGGKFTEITVGATTTAKGHIVCLDADTGEVYG